MRTGSRQPGSLFDDLLDEVGNLDANIPIPVLPGVLFGDPHSQFAGERIVRTDDRADAVLQRSDDPATIRVVLRIGAEDHAEVERQPDCKATNLHIPFFEDVKQSDLDFR